MKNIVPESYMHEKVMAKPKARFFGFLSLFCILPSMILVLILEISLCCMEAPDTGSGLIFWKYAILSILAFPLLFLLIAIYFRFTEKPRMIIRKIYSLGGAFVIHSHNNKL